VLRLVSDENFTEGIVQGLLRRCPELDLVRSRDEGLRGADDPALLAWAAANQRVLLTHDRQTMPGHAYDRVVQGWPMPGVFVVSTQLAPGRAIEDILTLVLGSWHDDEWKDQVLFVPL
jgi:hypothetical protein